MAKKKKKRRPNYHTVELVIPAKAKSLDIINHYFETHPDDKLISFAFSDKSTCIMVVDRGKYRFYPYRDRAPHGGSCMTKK